MVRIPRGIEQVFTAYLTGAIVQRLSRSPAVLQATHRILHEWDTLPERLAGRPVPYTPPHHSHTSSEHVSNEDYGEPHDQPSPFPVSGKYHGDTADLKRAPNASKVSTSSSTDPSTRSTSVPNRDQVRAEEKRREAIAQEIRDWQEKLRRPPG
ncbi:hypothetical protein MYAM1_003891 [Malassezia yamatoensis]|uniref:Uncharacterized protein n=1 Tax=Malassezia yamatoensis TaxID=253288 RepID=A0AAJ6CIM6_9BASI|nr:hypothetical protein MYAM1_003891 [Malassezia yamatoensis]